MSDRDETLFYKWWHEQGRRGDPAKLSPRTIFEGGVLAARAPWSILDRLWRTSGQIALAVPDSREAMALIEARQAAWDLLRAQEAHDTLGRDEDAAAHGMVDMLEGDR